MTIQTPITTRTEAKAHAERILKEAQSEATGLADKWGFNLTLGSYSGIEYVPQHRDDSVWTESDAVEGTAEGIDYWTSSNEGSWVSSSDKCY